MKTQEIRARFAPSPTGYLHVGGARTALYDYLFAKNRKGKFILRIEDTDEERSTEESMKMQLQDLKWLGLDWDEGVHAETLEDFGEYGPYRQSQRKHIYKEHADRLLKSGQAFYCFLTDEEIEQQREQALNEGRNPHIKSPYRDMNLEAAEAKIQEGAKAVVRFKTPIEVKEYKFTDLVRGEVCFQSDMVGDFVLLRSGGMPVYNFCCAVDDALMKITHVFRAEEHLNNTLRQMMIYEAFGYQLPEFGHVSIILGEDRQKLSKRHGATSVNQYNEMGYLPEAMNNFLALLGWSSPEGKEIMSMSEMVDQFSVDRLHSSSAVFDETKLKWVNATHLRALDNLELWQLLQPHFKNSGLQLPEAKEWVEKSLNLFKPYMEILSDAVELYRPLSLEKLVVAEEAQEVLNWETTPAVVACWRELLSSSDIEFLDEDLFNEYQNKIKNDCGVKGKNLFMPIRVAIIGKPHGADLKILVPLLSREVLLKRAEVILENY